MSDRPFALGPEGIYVHIADDGGLFVAGEDRQRSAWVTLDELRSRVERARSHGARVAASVDEGGSDLARPVVAELVDSGDVSWVQRFDETRRDGGITALMSAAAVGALALIDDLVARGADLEARDDEGHTALLIAANYGVAESCRRLLDLGAALEARDDRGDTALVMAAWMGHPDAVAALLDAGADPEARRADGLTAFDLARGRDHDAVVEVLAAHGVDTAAAAVAASDERLRVAFGDGVDHAGGVGAPATTDRSVANRSVTSSPATDASAPEGSGATVGADDSAHELRPGRQAFAVALGPLLGAVAFVVVAVLSESGRGAAVGAAVLLAVVGLALVAVDRRSRLVVDAHRVTQTSWFRTRSVAFDDVLAARYTGGRSGATLSLIQTEVGVRLTGTRFLGPEATESLRATHGVLRSFDVRLSMVDRDTALELIGRGLAPHREVLMDPFTRQSLTATDRF